MFTSRFTQSLARSFSTSAARANVARMTLVGRVGAAPQPLESKNGNPYVKYPIAVTTGKEQTSWFNVLAFDERLIEFLKKYVDKGSLVYVEADASISKYVAEDGTSRSNLTLIQQSISPLTWPKRDTNAEEAEPQEPTA